MKSVLPGAVRYIFSLVLIFVSNAVDADNSSIGHLAAEAGGGGSSRLGEFFSLESVLIIVFVLLVLAVIARKTKSP